MRYGIGLSHIVDKADFILIGTITKIDLLEPDGNELSREYYSANGPGRNNTIRFHIKVDHTHPLKSKPVYVPEHLVITTLWKYFQTVPQMKGFQGQTLIFFLKGEKFDPVFPHLFFKSMSEKAAIEKLLNSGQPSNHLIDRPAAR